MSRFEYINENGNYSLVDDTKRILSFSPYELALVYTYDADEREIKGTLLKHGQDKYVKAYHLKMVNTLRAQIDKVENHTLASPLFSPEELKIHTQRMIDNTHLFIGPVPLEELNKIINITGYVAKFHEKFILANKLDTLTDLFKKEYSI